MVKKRKIYHEAVELAELLIKTDKLWMAGKFGDREDVKKCEKNTEVELLEKIEAHVKKTGQGERKKIEVEKKQEERQQTPLLLATQTGCSDIVKKILEMHPQAAEQTDKKGRCILHIAIKYRQMEIFKMVEDNKFLMGRLIQNRDLKGYSILHMVGKNIRNKDEECTARYSPCFQLKRDLILFEKIKEIIPSRFHKHRNITRRQTAEELLALNKEALREKSQEWLERMAENRSIVAVLIATVAFAAAYTVPGGSNPDGSPVFINQTFFGIFTIGDVLSLTFCLTAVIIFLWVLSSSFQLKEFKYALPMKLMLGIACLLFSVTMMMLAFSATIILMIHNNERWTRIALYTAALLPVTVLATIYMPLFRNLGTTLKYTGKKIRSYFPKKIEADHDVLVCYTTTSSPTAENSCSFV